jgi:hypothetical protein
MSEGEATTTMISIPAIMSKLEQVKSYLQEAQALHQQMKDRLAEPGMAAQVSKMGKLVEDLRRQESGYLTILVKLLDQQRPADSAQMGGGESEEPSEGGGSEGEMPFDGNKEETGGGEGNDSMSLKAELLKERMEAQRAEREKQDEELVMLRHQRDLLRKLLEQQQQIEALESRQKSLLEQSSSDSTQPQAHSSGAVALQSGAGQDEGEQNGANNEETSSALAGRLLQLRGRQARVEQLTSLLNQLKAQTGLYPHLSAI